jgi:hypothetical protein
MEATTKSTLLGKPIFSIAWDMSLILSWNDFGKAFCCRSICFATLDSVVCDSQRMIKALILTTQKCLHKHRITTEREEYQARGGIMNHFILEVTS